LQRILQTILSKLLDALNVHLKNYDKTVKGGRSLIISKLFSLLVGWLMAIDPDIFTGTQLRQIVFDTVEYALHISGVGEYVEWMLALCLITNHISFRFHQAETEKLLPHPPVDQSEENKQLKSLSFKVSPDQRPRFSANDMAMVNDVTFETDDTDSVKVTYTLLD
jgi:hypothetical protein